MLILSIAPVSAFAETGGTASLRIEAEETDLYNGEEFTVSINFDSAGHSCYMLQYALCYDSSLLTLVSAENGSIFGTAGAPTVNTGTAGKIYMNWDTINAPINGTVTLLTLKFRVTAAENDSTAIEIDDSEEMVFADDDLNIIAVARYNCDLTVYSGERPETEDTDTPGQYEPDETKEDLVTSLGEPNIALSKSYIIMAPGEVQEINIAVSPEWAEELVSWSAQRVDGAKGNVLTLARSVNDKTRIKIKANANAGNVSEYIIASVKYNGRAWSARCRVDVAENVESGDASAAITQVTTSASKLTVELYKTDYTRIEVFAEMEQLNQIQLNELVDEETVATTVAGTAGIKRAEFSDSETAACFDLRVADDRNLEIIPKYETLEAAQENAASVKKAYKSGISIYLTDDEDEELLTVKDLKGQPAVLSLTVKKSTPTIKAGALKFNSLLFEDTQKLKLSGGTVTALEEDTAAAAKAKKTAVPQWLQLNGTAAATANADAPAKESGKLYLLATVDGWSIKRPVAVSYTVSAAKPKLSFKPASVNLKPGTDDAVSVPLSISAEQFRDSEKYPVVFSITEGTASYENGEVLDVQYEDGTVTVKPVLNDGLKHTYKVTASVSGKTGTAGSAALTVKLLEEKAAVTITAKASGAIDTAIKNSPVTVKLTPKNYNAASISDCDVRIEKSAKGIAAENVTNRFLIRKDGTNITITEKNTGTLEKGFTYTAYIAAYVSEDQTTPETAVKLPVKWSAPEKVRASVSIKAKGSIDLIRPNSAVTITPTYKNYYGDVLANSRLVIYENGAEVTDGRFSIKTKDGNYVIYAADAASINLKAKYTAALILEDPAANAGCTAKSVKLTLSMKAPKLTADVKSVSLFARDCYDTAEFTLKCSDKTLSQIKEVRLDAASDALFSVYDLGSGRFAIGYEGAKIPAGIKSGVTKTVKLSVYFEGSSTANASISLKVNIQ